MWAEETKRQDSFFCFFLNLRVIFKKSMGDGRQFCHHELPFFRGVTVLQLPSFFVHHFETARTER